MTQHHEIAAGIVGFVCTFAFYFWAVGGYKFDPRWLPAVLVVIDIAAAIGYGVDGGAAEWRKIVYWCAAATLTTVVTW